MRKAVLFDSGTGNLHSLARALQHLGLDTALESNPEKLLAGDLLVLPGVGAFGPAAARLEPARNILREALAQGFPCLGICLGMQLLFSESEEGAGQGIGLFPGKVTSLRALRVPHMGWSLVGTELFYFAHTYACRPDELSVVRTWSQHGEDPFPAVVSCVRTLGVQFHPEKSSRIGLTFLKQACKELLS